MIVIFMNTFIIKKIIKNKIICFFFRYGINIDLLLKVQSVNLWVWDSLVIFHDFFFKISSIFVGNLYFFVLDSFVYFILF
jgi:hypothetical protein